MDYQSIYKYCDTGPDLTKYQRFKILRPGIWNVLIYELCDVLIRREFEITKQKLIGVGLFRSSVCNTILLNIFCWLHTTATQVCKRWKSNKIYKSLDQKKMKLCIWIGKENVYIMRSVLQNLICLFKRKQMVDLLSQSLLWC